MLACAIPPVVKALALDIPTPMMVPEPPTAVADAVTTSEPAAFVTAWASPPFPRAEP